MPAAEDKPVPQGNKDIRARNSEEEIRISPTHAEAGEATLTDCLLHETLRTTLTGKSVLIIVENLPVPFDRRVWLEARTLKAAGANVIVICPTGKGFTRTYELIEGIHVYRHPLPVDANGAIGYVLEYSAALIWESVLAWKVYWRHGFDVIHGCNPPDLVFLVALQFRMFGVRYIFDHHDINPELYEAKFNRRGLFWKMLVLLERLNFMFADVSIATNNSYREIAIQRGRMRGEDVFVVRSGPDLRRMIPVPPNHRWNNNRKFLVGYVGVMGDQEGIDLLLQAVHHLVYIGSRSDIQFVLVGGGPALQGLQRLSKELGLEEFVTFTGRVPDSELFEVLSSADVCVNPDRPNEMNDRSTMNKIMEYMAFKKPIVQFDLTEGRFSADQASLYAKNNDIQDFALKIQQLLEDPVRRRNMGRLGYERLSEKLSWSHQVGPLLAAYRRALRLK